jgi:hypothetical protein
MLPSHLIIAPNPRIELFVITRIAITEPFVYCKAELVVGVDLVFGVIVAVEGFRC